MTVHHVQLKDFIRDVPDFPKPGILFRDITPLLGNPQALGAAIESLANPYRCLGVDYVAAVEARGFIFGSAVAKALNAGFIPIRKKEKLPYTTESYTYDLEYGSDVIEVHTDAVSKKGSTVLMIDDLLATGGTMAAACKLMEKIGANICGLTFLVELSSLNGREKLKGYEIHSVITY